jgi:hypothetical protein
MRANTNRLVSKSALATTRGMLGDGPDDHSDNEPILSHSSLLIKRLGFKAPVLQASWSVSSDKAIRCAGVAVRNAWRSVSGSGLSDGRGSGPNEENDSSATIGPPLLHAN